MASRMRSLPRNENEKFDTPPLTLQPRSVCCTHNTELTIQRKITTWPHNSYNTPSVHIILYGTQRWTADLQSTVCKKKQPDQMVRCSRFSTVQVNITNMADLRIQHMLWLADSLTTVIHTDAICMSPVCDFLNREVDNSATWLLTLTSH